MVLTDCETERYDRQLIIEGWGSEGQKKLKASRVAVVGVGGLGCPASLYLAAAGIGNLKLIDEGKFKLSQNRSAADRAGVMDGLRKTGLPGDTALADLMAARED